MEGPPSHCLQIDNPNLAEDSGARSAIKDETVAVTFAESDGDLLSAVGINRYRLGDAILTGSTGDQWSVSRDRFDAKYAPQAPTLPGRPGSYRNRPVPVLAKRVDQAFTVSRTAGGDVLRGNAGDWLIQYAPGDYGIVDQARFERVYRLLIAPTG